MRMESHSIPGNHLLGRGFTSKILAQPRNRQSECLNYRVERVSIKRAAVQPARDQWFVGFHRDRIACLDDFGGSSRQQSVLHEDLALFHVDTGAVILVIDGEREGCSAAGRDDGYGGDDTILGRLIGRDVELNANTARRDIQEILWVADIFAESH